jgi:hypothetical protein
MITGLIPLAGIGVGPFRANAGPKLRHKNSMVVPTLVTISKLPGFPNLLSINETDATIPSSCPKIVGPCHGSVGSSLLRQ